MQPYIKTASEVSNYQNKNIILIGGPCANKISEEITNLEGYNCDDWKFDHGKALVKVFDNGNKKAILVAGTTKGDTLRISNAITRYDKSNILQSSDEAVFETPEDGECGNDICDIRETDENCPNDCFNEESIQLTSNLIVKTFDISGNYLTFHTDEEGIEIPIYENISTSSTTINSSHYIDNYIYLYDLESRQQTRIGQGSWPKIDGDYVVFQTHKNGLNEFTGRRGLIKQRISLYKISTEETITLAESEVTESGFTEGYEFPIISGNNVVWIEYSANYEDWNKPYELMLYDIESESTRKLVDINKEKDSNFDIYNDKIVYEGPKYCDPEYCLNVVSEVSPGHRLIESAEEGDQDTWLYDIDTNEKTRITSNEEYQGMPRIYENTIVWVDYRSIAEGKKEIYMYNIVSREEGPLNIDYKSSGSGHTTLSISDNQIVWTDHRNENSDVYWYDIERNIEQRITFNSNQQGDAKIDGNYIVWVDHRNNRQDLYMLKL